MKTVQWGSIIGGFLIAIGPKLSKLAEWNDVTSTSFIGELAVEVGGMCLMVWGALDAQTPWRKKEPPTQP